MVCSLHSEGWERYPGCLHQAAHGMCMHSWAECINPRKTPSTAGPPSSSGPPMHSPLGIGQQAGAAPAKDLGICLERLGR